MLEAQQQDIEGENEAGTEAASDLDSGAESPAESTVDRTEEAADDDSQSDTTNAEGASDLEKAVADRDQAVAEKAELLDRYQRAQAEFDNLRKRLMREKEEATTYAAMDTIRSLLPFADDFERALATEELNEEVRKGLDLVYKSMFDVFTRAGLRPVEEDGKFDPHVHHAVDKQPAETDEEDQKVLEVYQRGYHFKDRLLRPAMVQVAVKD